MSQILYNSEASQKLVSGVNKLSKAVTTTLGPRGRNVAFIKDDEAVVTHDGVTVAKEFVLTDKFEEIGAKLVRQAAVETNNLVGDGTTTSILLANKIIQEGYKLISSGHNPMLIRKGISKAAEKVVEYINSVSKDVVTDQDMEYVASVSCQDPELGKKISSAFQLVEKGNVIVSESKSNNVKINHLDGMRFEKGYMSPYFINKEEDNKCVLDNPMIIVSERKITNMNMIYPIIEKMLENGTRTLLIISQQLSDPVLKPLILNKISGTFDVCAVEPPSYGNTQKQMLEDMAISLGATLFNEMSTKKIEDFDLSDLGRCEKAIITTNKTILLNGNGNKDQVESRIKIIKSQMENSSEYNKNDFKDRLTLLSNGVAEIMVGAPSESELKEKKMLVEDAVNALMAAQKDGIVMGGGITFLSASDYLKDKKSDFGNNEEILMGVDIVRKALFEPLRKICFNSGKNGDVILAEILSRKKLFDKFVYGYDVVKHQYTNMDKAGIIDPAMVLTSAITNAASVSTSILTTNAIIVENKKEI